MNLLEILVNLNIILILLGSFAGSVRNIAHAYQQSEIRHEEIQRF